MKKQVIATLKTRVAGGKLRIQDKETKMKLTAVLKGPCPVTCGTCGTGGPTARPSRPAWAFPRQWQKHCLPFWREWGIMKGNQR